MPARSCIILDTLPPDHPLRNRPLDDVDAAHESGNPLTWKPVKRWLIGRATYNQLADVWHAGRFSVPTEEPAP